MGDYEESKSIVRRFYDGVNINDRELMDSFLDENYVFHNWRDTFTGRDAVHTFLDDIQSAFPDMRIEVGEQVADDTYVVSRLRMTGTHDGEFDGIAPTNMPVDVTGMVMFRFDGDRIAEQWAEWDILRILSQIGARPTTDPNC